MNGVGANTQQTNTKGVASELSLAEPLVSSADDFATKNFEEMLALDNAQPVNEARDFLVHVDEIGSSLADADQAAEEAVEPADLKASSAEMDGFAGLATVAVVDKPIELLSGSPTPNEAEPAVEELLPGSSIQNDAKPAVEEADRTSGKVANLLRTFEKTSDDTARVSDGEELSAQPEPSAPPAASEAKGLKPIDGAATSKPIVASPLAAELIAEGTKKATTFPINNPSKTLETKGAQSKPLSGSKVTADLVEEDEGSTSQRIGGNEVQLPLGVSLSRPSAEAHAFRENAVADSEIKADVIKIKLTPDGDLSQDGTIKAETEQKQPATVNLSAPGVLEMRGRDLLQVSAPPPDGPQHATKDILPQATLALNLRDAQWGQKLVAQIEKMHSEGSARYEISLRPKNLGDMKVSLEILGDETQVRIVTETTAASRVLIGAEDRLAQMLDAAGYKLSSLSASMGTASQSGNNQGQSPSKQKQHDMSGKSKARGETASEAVVRRTNSGQASAVNVLA